MQSEARSLDGLLPASQPACQYGIFGLCASRSAASRAGEGGAELAPDLNFG
jgi:hypothetical protein